MKFSFETYRIECTHPFGISRSSHSFYDVVFIYLEHNGLIGRGEAAPSNRYNESTERILSVLNKGITVPDNMDDIHEFFNHFSEHSMRFNGQLLHRLCDILITTMQFFLNSASINFL